MQCGLGLHHVFTRAINLYFELDLFAGKLGVTANVPHVKQEPL